jgi:uncharacterized membrane protein (UPF0136 family)
VDESISIKQAQGDYSQAFEAIKDDIHPPLYIILLHFWVKFFGTSELSSRFLSLVFGVLSVWIMYLLSRKLFSEKAALIAAALMAFSPIMIYYSQEARNYSLFVLLALLSFYFFINYIYKKNYKNQAAYCFFSLLLIYTHIFSFLIIFAQNIYILYRYKFKIKKLLNWFAGQLILLLLFMPWLPILFRQAHNKMYSWLPKPDLGMLAKTVIDFFGNRLNLSIFLILIIVIILTKKYKQLDKNKIFFLSSWIILPFLIVLCYSIIFPSLYHTRYMLFVLPAILIIFSLLIERISRKNKFFAYALLFIVIISSFVSIVNQVNNTDKDNWRVVSDFIEKNAKGNDVVFIDPFYNQYPFTYYYDKQCFSESDTYACNNNKHRILSLDSLAECCNAATLTYGQIGLWDYIIRDVWLVSLKPGLYKGNYSLFDYFNNSKRLVYSKTVGDIKLDYFKGVKIKHFEDNWQDASDFIQKNSKEDDFIFIEPYNYQEIFAYYHDKECLNKSSIYSCNFDMHNILSLNWQAKCCNDTTKLSATDGKNQLGDYTAKNVWLIDVRPELYNRNYSLFNYFNSSKRLMQTERFEYINLYKFE